MYSGEGEIVALIPPIYPKGTVEYWLLDVENVMRNTVKETLKAALKTVEITPRDEWVLQWPGQVVIAISQTTWTAHVELGIQTDTLNEYYETTLSHVCKIIHIFKNLSVNRVNLCGRVPTQGRRDDGDNCTPREKLPEKKYAPIAIIYRFRSSPVIFFFFSC